MIRVTEHIPVPIGGSVGTKGKIDQAFIMCGVEVTEEGDIVLHLGEFIQYCVVSEKLRDTEHLYMIGRPTSDKSSLNWPFPEGMKLTEQMTKERDKFALPISVGDQP